jgi:SPX domain protein involved in polyphosphate accumulation
MAFEVFNRTEEKYIITEEIYRTLRSELEDRMLLDGFCRNDEFYTICNIYYDTPDHQMIRHSIEKPIYKEKLRLRSYGTVSSKDKVYIEIKKKFKGYVNKRRCSMQLEDACNYLVSGKHPEGKRPERKRPSTEQVLREVDCILQRYPDLAPALYLSYDRIALFGKEKEDFRITFDTNIRTRRHELGLDKGNYGELLLPQGLWIMEAKANDAMPYWFSRLLSEYRIYTVNFSKYGEEYRRALKRGELSKLPTGQNRMCV